MILIIILLIINVIVIIRQAFYINALIDESLEINEGDDKDE